jgi:hypothetical protein
MQVRPYLAGYIAELGKKKINDFQVGCQDIEQVVKQ